MSHLCDDDIEAVDNFNLFYRVRMAYCGVGNIGVAGFESFMRWTFVDMLTRVVSVTVGPTKYVYYGVQTNDAFFYDNNYYYRLVTEARKAGIKAPIIPGVMPLVNSKNINRIKI